MKMFFTVVVVSLAIIAHRGAGAAEAAKPMTVGEVVEIGAAIGSLDSHPSGAVDGRGNPVMVPNNFHFVGSATMTLALNFARYRDIKKVLDEQATDLRIKMVGPGKDVPKEKMDEFSKQVAELQAAPANVTLGHISVQDLCLDVAPPRCPQRNEIPVATLGALSPIIDQ